MAKDGGERMWEKATEELNRLTLDLCVDCGEWAGEWDRCEHCEQDYQEDMAALTWEEGA
jgi:hypothetical protein